MSIRKNFLEYTFFIILHLICLIVSQKTRSENELNCIRANSNWRNLYSKEDLIKDPSTCTSISDSCCHISIKYNYHGLFSMEKSYCYAGTGKVEDWVKKFTNLYQDEIRYYASKFNASLDDYTKIGNNLDYEYYSNYTCKETAKEDEYSDYEIRNCAYFNSDGTCGIKNDEKYFDKFLEILYVNITADICNNKDLQTGKCIEYSTDPNSNPNALTPLMNLIKSTIEQVILEEKKNEQKETKTWPGPCTPIPKVYVQVTCPNNYIASNFLFINKFLIVIIVSLLFF